MEKQADQEVDALTTNSESDSEQYLTFIMDGEEYGVDILSVQEIRGWESATLIPNSPHYLRGVINLRGTIVPILDLRARFKLPEVEYSKTTVVIVLKLLSHKGKERILGIVVDAVSDVYSFTAEDLRDSPDVGNRVNSAFIKGLVDVNKKMVILLQLENIIEVETDVEITK